MADHQNAMKTGTTIVFVIGTLLAIAGYCMLTFWAKPVLNNAKNSVNWPTVPGVITRSELKHHDSDDGTTYSAAITYRYTVEEDEIHGETVWFGDGYSSSDIGTHQKVVNRYREGAEVEVYYNPNDKFVAVLEPGAVASSYVGYIVSWIMMIIGGVLLLIPMSGWLKFFRSHDSVNQSSPIA